MSVAKMKVKFLTVGKIITAAKQVGKIVNNISFAKYGSCANRSFPTNMEPTMDVSEVTADQLHVKIQDKIDQKMSHSKGAQKFNVIVEGNVGSGKTMLINHFSNFRNIEILSEPVDKWRNLHGHNLLELMYTDPSRWGLTFQTFVQLTMIDLHTRKQVLPVRLMERSIFSARYCFVENLFRLRKLPEVEYVVLTEWFKWLLNNSPISVDLIVYLRADPEVIHERVKKRARPEERTVSLDYLRQLHQLHEEWLIDQTHFKAPAPVLILDANNNMETMFKLYEEHSEQIMGNGKILQAAS